MFWNKYPYSNLHDLNLDWIIAKMKEIESNLAFVIDNASLKYADPLAWSITHQYQANTVVIDPETGIAYLSTKPVPTNILITDTNYWTPIFNLETLFEDIKKSISFNLETGSNSQNNYAAGDYFFIDNSLYKALTAITSGMAFAEGVNVEMVSVTDLIKNLESALGTATDDIADINDDIDGLTERVNNISAEIEGVSDEVITEVNDELTYKFNSVFISNIRKDNPDYNDDQLMNAALDIASDMASNPLIVWDHHDANFSGTYSFDLTPTSGIDFNDQNIYMPAVNIDLFYVHAADTVDKNVSSALLNEYYVSDSELFNKYFSVNSSTNGSSEMCAGTRYNSTEELYVCYGIVTDPKGQITNNKMNYLPSGASVVPLYNIHAIPDFVTVFRNAHVIYPASDKMAVLFRARRSRIHITNIKVSGYTNITTYHTGVFSITNAAYIEVDHIYGVNPIQAQLTSGYLLSIFNGCTDVHIHDCDMHDSEYQSWGMLGMNCITNLVMERVNTDRFDCHYFAWGYVTVRECHINYVNLCAGVCNWTIENCEITRRDSNLHFYIGLRSDSPARFNGELKITNCRFRTDPSSGASDTTTRVLNLSMVHNLLGNFTASGLLNSYATVYISNCNIGAALCVLQCEDKDSGNGDSLYKPINVFINDCNINLSPSVDHPKYVLYRFDNANISMVNILNVSNSQVMVNIFTASEITHLFVIGCALDLAYAFTCLKRVTNALISSNRFRGFDTTRGTMFTNLVCSGNEVANSDVHWNTNIATNYVLSGNMCFNSETQAAWIASNSFGV